VDIVINENKERVMEGVKNSSADRYSRSSEPVDSIDDIDHAVVDLNA